MALSKASPIQGAPPGIDAQFLQRRRSAIRRFDRHLVSCAAALGAALSLAAAQSAEAQGLRNGLILRAATPPDAPLTLEAPDEGAREAFEWTGAPGSFGACEGAECTWERIFGGAADDKVAAAVQAVDGAFMVVGNTRLGSSGAYDAWVLRVAADGALVWRGGFGGPATDQLLDVVASPDGGAIAVGHTRSRGSGESDLWLLKLAADGSTVFERAFGGPANDRARAAAAGPDGGVFAVGYTASTGAGGRDLWIARFSPEGDAVWSRTLGSDGHDEGFDLVSLPDGGVAVTGHFQTADARGYDVAVARFSADGDLLWRRSFDRSGFEAGTALAAAPDGGLLVVGSTSVEGLRDTDLWAIRLDADGARLWDRTYGGARGEAPWEVAASAQGGFVVAVETFSHGAGGGDIWLLRLDPVGEVVWERLFGGVLWDHPSALLETPEGGLLVGGHTASSGPGFEDGWLLRLTADGRL